MDFEKNLLQEIEAAKARANTYNMKQLLDVLASIPSFAEDRDENQWKILNDADSGDNYTPLDIDNIQATAKKLYYTNPSAGGLVDTMVNFIIGKTATITPKSTDKKVQQYWNAFCRKNGWDRRSREHVKRSFRDGESFIRLFKPLLVSDLNSFNSLLNQVPLVRFVEPSEIKDDVYTFGIETDPEDVETVLNYHRKYKVNNDYRKEVIPADEIIHTKIRADSNMKRGVSFYVGIGKYLVKYENWLNDRILLNKIRTLFNVIMKVSGMNPTDFKSKFEDTKRKTPHSDPSKKLPKPGSVLVSTPSVEYQMLNLNIRAQDTKDDGRAIELMIAKGTNLTEYIVRGDASNSNYSSTMVSESPMVRMFESWQDYFEEDFKRLYSRVIQIGVELGILSENTDDECEVNYPGLIHRDMETDTKAAVLQVSGGLSSRKTASEFLGLNHEREKELIKKEEDEDYEQRSKRENHIHDDGE